MARKRYSDEDILNLLWQIELDLNTGSDVASACRKALDQLRHLLHLAQALQTAWRSPKLQEFIRPLEKENARLKRIVADLELDKLILKESLNYLKPTA